jgi:hypothetical protein
MNLYFTNYQKDKTVLLWYSELFGSKDIKYFDNFMYFCPKNN